MRVRKAIIPAAGLGTRFLPATKAMPKEMLPIVDKPTIQYIVEEAVASGIEDILIVTGKGKRAIEDHFDHAFELERALHQAEKWSLLEEVRKSSNLVDIHYIRQKEARGLGHAVWCARKFIGDEPFAVLLGDDIVDSPKPALLQLIEQASHLGKTVIGVQHVPLSDVSKYGIVVPDGSQASSVGGRLHLLRHLVEKPALSTTPSTLAIMGRYVLNPRIFERLAHQQPGAGQEIQLTDAIASLCQEEAVYAYEFEGKRYDVGEKFGFIRTTLDFALKRADLREPLFTYMEQLLAQEQRSKNEQENRHGMDKQDYGKE